jgi:hypothetical protein
LACWIAEMMCSPFGSQAPLCGSRKTLQFPYPSDSFASPNRLLFREKPSPIFPFWPILGQNCRKSG